MKIKADEKNNLDLVFKSCNCVILSIEDIQTTNFGIKTKMTLKNKELNDFQVFVNSFSMKKLIDIFGDEDSQWIGKNVNLTKEEDTVFNTEMIVINPLK